MSGNKKILIITYYWPPCGGAGVQRWLKFVKYLPNNGWEPVILTVDPEFATYPSLDLTLESDINPETKIFKTRATDYFKFLSRRSGTKGIPSAGFASNDSSTLFGKFARFVRGNFFIPDPRKGWNKYAYRKALEIISDNDIDYIVTTGPPHSTHLIGLRLKKKFPDLKWIADFRDPWTEIYYYKNFFPTRLSSAIDRRYERKTLQKSDLIFTVGETLANHLVEIGLLQLSKVIVIPNGYDSDDFKNKLNRSEETAIITYAGTLSSQYPTNGLVKALKDVIESRIKFRFRFVGSLPDNIKQDLIDVVGKDQSEFIPYCNHKEAIDYISESTVLLLIIPNHRGNRSIITGKIFEYLATGNPVLCIGPTDGDAANIISENSAGNTFGYEDWQGMSEYLKRNITNPVTYNVPDIYSREHVVKHISNSIK